MTGVRLGRVPEAVLAALADGASIRSPDWHPQFPAADTGVGARLLLEAFALTGTVPEGSPWWMYAIVVDGLVSGEIGYHGPPAATGPCQVEIGYEVVPAVRGRGVATRACRLLLEHAWRHGADVVHADADAENLASRAVLRANGFRLTAAGDFAVERPPSRT